MSESNAARARRLLLAAPADDPLRQMACLEHEPLDWAWMCVTCHPQEVDRQRVTCRSGHLAGTQVGVCDECFTFLAGVAVGASRSWSES